MRNFCTKIRGQIGSSEMISSNHMCRDFRLLHIYMPRQHCKRRSRDLKRGRVEPELTFKKYFWSLIHKKMNHYLIIGRAYYLIL